MHDHFSDWLAESGIGLLERPLVQWWEGLSEYCASSNRERLLALLRFACSADAADDLVPSGFREAIKNKDAGLAMRGNTFLVLQLARAAVRSLFDPEDGDPDLATAAALGLVSGSFGQAVGRTHKEHLEAAQRYLVARADELRDPDEQRAPTATSGDEAIKEINAALKDIAGSGDLDKLKPSLAKLFELTRLSSLPSLIQNVDVLASRLRLREEELNILWWLFGESSRDIGKPFAAISPGVAAVLASSELADLTVFPPGPRSFQAVLDRVLRLTAEGGPRAKAKIATIVHDLDPSWRNRAAARLRSLGGASALCPVHLMIAKATEAATPADWPALVRASCTVAPDLEIDARALAAQVYEERMFVHSLDYGRMRRGG